MESHLIVVLGHILNPQTDKKCEVIKDGALVIKNKKILKIGPSHKILKSLSAKEFQIVDYNGYVILPSFFDMHFHWVQDDVREMPKANLLEWLSRYTFPAENKFKNKKY